MSIEKFVRWTVAGVCVVLTGCSGGSGSDASTSTTSITAAVQELTLDADGLTTLITFDRAVAGLTAANFEADGGQNATAVDIDADQVLVEWSDRVTPAHQVRVVGASSFASGFAAVTTTDSSAPIFAITDADQIAGLGNDVIQVQFTGPRVVESEAEDAGNWTLTVDGVALDLTGSVFALNPATQALTITTGDLANLHATFTLTASSLHSVADVALASNPHNGAATGDSTPPTLVSVLQNLAEDEYGRVVDLTFSEAMDPVFATNLSSFGANAPDLATAVLQPAEHVLRVTFNNPMLPGVDSIDLASLVDAHGNDFVDQTSAISAGSTVANGWASSPVMLAVSNQGGDQVVAATLQALDPDTAEDPTRWELTMDPNGTPAPVDLSSATFDYDLVSKTLTIGLVEDYPFAAEFSFTAAASAPLDVDGQIFAGAFQGLVSGDDTPPAMSSAVQRRGIDYYGKTIDVTFDEDLDQTSAELLANWTVSGANVVSATLQSNLKVVRLVLDAVAVPGDATLDASGVSDLAQSPMVPVLAMAITSTDTDAPGMTSAVATAVEGDGNDTLVVSFDDAMLASEVEDPANWSFQSPLGTTLDLGLATFDYRVIGRYVTVTFAGATGIDLQLDQGFQVALANARDVGGNTITSTALTGTVDGERTLPDVVTVWVETAAQNELHVRFSEPCQFLDDIAGLTQYVVRTSGGVIRGYPTSATVDADEMGVELVFGFALAAGSDTLDLRGVADLAGNPAFPRSALSIAVEDPNAVALDLGTDLATVSGEANDVLTVQFDRRPSPWTLLDVDHYLLELAGTPIDLSAATLSFDGDRTVTIDMTDTDGFATGATYDLTVSGIQSAQGVDLAVPATQSLLAAGDATPPSLPIGRARLDAADPSYAVLIELDEAVDPTAAALVTNIDLNGATNPDTVELLGFRTLRATFAGGVTTSDTIDVTATDLAGNTALASRAITAQDAAGPLVVSVQGVAVAGLGGDWISVQYDEQVDLTSALTPGSYTLTNGATSIDLTGADLVWSSSTNVLTIALADGVELDPALTLNLQVANVYDHSGLVMSPSANVFGTVTGDTVVPAFGEAFANYRADAGGLTIDVLFSEDVDAAVAGQPGNWSASGGQSVLSATSLNGSWWRIELGSALTAGDSLQISALPDLAGNTSGALAVVPSL